MRRFSTRRVRETLRTIGIKQLSNAVRNKVEAASGSVRLRSFPQVVDIVLTKACNLKCTFCKDYETEGAKLLSIEHFERAANILFPTARKLSLCSGGEPYLHKRLVNFLRITKQYRVPVWLLSNGTRITKETSTTIVNEQLVAWHGFSVDGIEAETVEAIRVKADFGLIVDNILRLIDIRERNGTRFPKIVIRYALMRSNIEQLPKAIEFWGSRGVDAIDCSYLSVCNGIDPQESLFFHADLTDRLFQKATEVCERFPSLSLSLPEPFLHLGSPGRSLEDCHQPWELIRIDSDGEILPCFHSWRLMTMGNIGSLDRSSFDQLWNGGRYRGLRASVNDDTVAKLYSHCANCSERVAHGHEAAHFEDNSWIDASVLAGKSETAVERTRKR